MTRAKLILIAFVVLIVTLGLGFVWGASGRFSIQAALDESRQQLDLAEARVSLYNVNFGDASRHFEEAKAPLRRAQERYREQGNRTAAERIGAALENATEGQRLAAKLDQSANTKAADALEAIRLASER